ncbi:protein Lines homolog 1 isoform X1 [Bufo bufo]|uniref:protein Lines homolog 1 isoform X1 n=1 Tax=Bufo bufo TaxID=8384 RepID=UPI001ABEAEAE|nr:protein Lines homolog 1 isoform X1 [Bufo bufo]
MKCTLFKCLKEMEGPFPDLKELHKKLLQAAPLHEDVSACAALLMPRLANEASNSSAIHENAGTETYLATTWVARDVTLLQLSLIQILIIKAENLCTEPQVRCQYSRVLELLQQNGADTTIIGLLQTSDKVLSHISSKCLSYLVLYQLKFKNEVNPHWLQFCLNTFSDDPGSPALMQCLMSLMAVYKGILVDERIRKADYLLQIMAALENVFEGFCSTWISRLSVTECQPPPPESSSQLSCLLDLLEVMVALRIELKLNVSLCKHVLSVILPQALNLMSCPVPYFVKKQVILVLKRCLLYKAGEDFLPSPHNINNQQDVVLDEDLAVLATTLLNAVRQGWLLQVPSGDRSSSFGGANEGAEHGPDLVILGAASLSVLKALEIQFRSKAYSSLGQGYTEFSETSMYMALLLTFLKQHLGWKEPEHFCEWVSLTFIEQDDDMLEVAKSLLQMYLHNPRPCTATSDDEDILKLPSHQCGMNPHCIFLFLLKNLLFDASVLLDFLISSETCFLEYFVRYLKLLKEDWPQFCSTCTFLDKSASLQLPTVASDSVHPLQTVGLSRAQESSVAGPKIGTPSPCSHQSESSSSLGALQRLVEYDSSEDSESEVSGSEPCPVMAHCAGGDSSDIDKHMKNLGLTAACLRLHTTSASKQTSTYQALGIQHKSAQCLLELQGAINRLHRKKLFPYNPSALLKLLTHVCALSKDQSTEM